MQGDEASVISTPEPSGSALTAPAQRADEIFLEGPRSRFDEFVTLLRVVRDFLRGFRVLHFVGPCVTVFGSARVRIALGDSLAAGLTKKKKLKASGNSREGVR